MKNLHTQKNDIFSGPSAPPSRTFCLAVTLCTIAALVPLWSVKYLPMVDLPQHTAQISIWTNYNDPAYGFEEQFEFNWFTPYLAGYALARLFAFFFPVWIAAKIAVSLAVLALPLSLFFLLRWTKADVWWTLAGFPLAFGHSYCWGNFNYILAIPLSLFFIGQFYGYARAPSRNRGLAAAFLSLFLFWTHIYVVVFCFLVAASFMVYYSRPVRKAVLRMLVFAPPLLITIIWIFTSLPSRSNQPSKTIWKLGFYRILELPGHLFGYPEDHLASAIGIMFLILLTASFLWPSGPRKKWILWMPSIIACMIYILAPYFLFGFLVWQRFSIFIVALSLIAINEPISLPFRRVQRAALVILTTGWMILLFSRNLWFNAEAKYFDQVFALMAPNKRVISLVFDKYSMAVPGPVFMHFVNYYQAEKGGTAVFSFSVYSHTFARFKTGARPSFMQPGFEDHPEQFDAQKQSGYDYFLFRMPLDPRTHLSINPGSFITERARTPVRLVANVGQIWLYERLGK